jgi:hypothetical protein
VKSDFELIDYLEKIIFQSHFLSEMYIFIKIHQADSFVLNSNLNSILTQLGLVIFSFFTTIFSYGQKTNLVRIEDTYISQINYKNAINSGLSIDIQSLNYHVKFRPN